MVFDVAAYDFDKVRGEEELSRDLVAMRTETKAKDRCCDERRKALSRSVSQPLLGSDREFCRLHLEARQLRELCEALKAKHFYTFSAVPSFRGHNDKKAEEEKIAVAVPGYGRIRQDVADAKVFAEHFKGFDEGDSAKIRIAQLEAKQLVAFNLLKKAQYKIKAVDAWHTRFNAAERVIAAYKKSEMRCSRCASMRPAARVSDAVEAARVAFEDDVARWNEASEKCMQLRRDIEECTFEKVFSAEENLATGGAQSAAEAPRSNAAQTASEAVRSPSVASSWDQLSAERSASASLDITVSTASGVASHNDTGSTIGNARCSSSISSVRASSSAARRYVATDSEDSDATVADLTSSAARTSTPVPRGDTTGALQSGRASAAEFGDTTTDSLASFVPRGAHARTVRSPQHYGYISASDRTSQNSGRSATAVQPQSRVVYPGYASLSARPMSFFDSAAAPRVDAQVDWENCTAFFVPLRRGISDGHFLTLVRNGHFGRAFPDAVKCVVAKSDPNRIPAAARRRDNMDKPYAAVTFAKPADAALCIRLVNDAARDFGVTPMGDNDAPRKLDAEWCLNPHLNGEKKAPRRRVPRY